jgi:hypothetical protein
MKVHIFPDETVRVEYFPCHSHPLDPKDFQHQPLSRATYDLIDQQLAWGVSPSKIRKLLQDGAFSRDNRDQETEERKNNYISSKLIRERRRKRRNAKRHHKDDATSVRMLYENLKKEKHNPVILYKPLGSECLEGPSEVCNLPDADDLFMFAIQTKAQEDLLKQGSSKAVLVDETHNTTQYDLKLLTVMVPDQNNRCWPVAHLISSRSDAVTLQYFFIALKNRCPDLNISCVLTDDDPALINSMELAFGKELRHLLCLWHLHQNFQKKHPHSKSSSQFGW